MELSLTREAKARPAVEAGDAARSRASPPIHPPARAASSSSSRTSLSAPARETGSRATRRKSQSICSRWQIASMRSMAPRWLSHASLAPSTPCSRDDLHVPVVDDVREVRRRDARLPATGLPVVDHDHRASFTREQVRGRQAGDAGADDADVGARVLLQRVLFPGCDVSSHTDVLRGITPEAGAKSKPGWGDSRPKRAYMTRQGGPKTLPAACRQDEQVWRLLQLNAEAAGREAFRVPTPFNRATPMPAISSDSGVIWRPAGQPASRSVCSSHHTDRPYVACATP